MNANCFDVEKFENELPSDISDRESFERLLRFSYEMRNKIAETTKQHDKITNACRMLLESPEVQALWPISGNNRAENPSETFSSAETKVKFRHLLRIHAAMKGGAK